MPNDTLEDWRSTTDILFNDVLRAVEQVDRSGDGYARRSYVRAVFAAIEGSTYGMKRVVLHVWKHLHPKLKADELELLTETKFEQGKVKKRFLAFGDNIKFVFGLFAKVHGFTSSADYRIKGWTTLLAAAEIRHRLMHPKSTADLKISDEELDKIRDGSDWYFQTRNRLMSQATMELRKRI